MPVRYRCRHCGAVLWEFKYVGQDYYGLPSPSEVMNVYGGICPVCKRELRAPSTEDIKINGATTSYGLEPTASINNRLVLQHFSRYQAMETAYKAEA